MNRSFRPSSQRPGGISARSFILASLFGAALHSASAQTLYSTGFENPPFAAGSNLLGQDGWSTSIPPFLNPDAAKITNTTAQSGLQSVQVRGVDLVTAPEVDPYAAVGSYRRPLNYDASGAQSIVRIQSDVRLDGPTLGTGDFFAANIAARTGDGFAGELSLSSDGNVYGYNGTGDDIIRFTTPVSLNAWHTLAITVDFAANTYAFSVDGTSSSAFPFEAGFVSDTLVRESLVTYARPDAGSNMRSDFVARYDNVSAIATPEPASAALLAMGAVAVLGFRRRQAPMLKALLLVASLCPLLNGQAATIMPVGPITFSTNASYDANFKEASINPGNTRNAGGYVQLQGSQYGPAVYDTSATGGSNGSGGTGGNDANKDFSNFTISADLASSETGLFGLGFLLRLDSSEANGYFASMLASGPNSVTFDLFEGAGLTQGLGSNIYSNDVPLTGLTLTTNRFYSFKVTVLNGNFSFNFGNGAATANFTDTTLSATTRQVGFVLTTASPTSASRLDNFAIVPEPNTALLLLMSGVGCVAFPYRRRVIS